MRGSKIKLDLLYRLIDVRFENWGILARVYPRIFPSFNWGPFGHLMGLHLSREREKGNLLDY